MASEMWGPKERRIFLSGTVLLVCSLILHIVCMSTHHYVVISVNDIGPNLARMIAQDKTLLGPDYDKVSEDTLKELNQTFLSMRGTCNFGMWKLCLTANQSGVRWDICMSWGTDLVFDKTSHNAKTLKSGDWIRGVQAMAIICILVGLPTLALALLNLVSESKGDRRRYLHFFIAAGSVITGALMLIGDLIMASNYTSILDSQLESAGPLSQTVTYPPPIIEMFREQFHLSWGFGLDIVAVAFACIGGLLHLSVLRTTVALPTSPSWYTRSN